MLYRKRRKVTPRVAQTASLLVLILPVLLARPVSAQTGGPFDLSWSTIDGGGITYSSGGDFTVGGTIGQPDAGVLSNGAFSVSGGFWFGGAGETSAVDPVLPETAPLALRLLGHSPNPFRQVTTIRYELPVDGTHVRIQVFDPSGREIAVLLDEVRDAGRHAAVWSGQDSRGRSVASGVYFYRFNAGSQSQVRKMVLIE